MPTKHNFHYLRPIYSPETLTFCYLMPFFRVFRVFRAWLWAKGIRWHTVHTAGSWARDTRCTRCREERRQCAYVGRIVCRTSRTSSTSEAGRTSRTSGTGRTSGVRMVHCSICLFLDCPFCEHILRKKNALSRFQGRFSPPRATRWLLPKNVNMLLNSLSH